MENLNEQIIKKAITKVLKEGMVPVYKLNANRKNAIKNAYNQIVSASAGWGTDPDKILLAIKVLNHPDEFRYLLTLFKDKKTGYSDFEKMINEEYDRFNYNDIVKLEKVLKQIKIKVTYKIFKNRAGQLLFDEGFRIKYIPPVELEVDVNKNISSACKTKWQSQLPKAVSFWRNWLKNPITRKRAEQNWKEESNFLTQYKKFFNINSAIAWGKYENTLANLRLVFYDDTMNYIGKNHPLSDVRKAYAFVLSDNNYDIYINCSTDDPDPYGSLIHEIQHIIYNIKPLNPAKKISDVFVTSKTVKQTEEKIKKSLPAEKNKTSSTNLITTAKNIGVSVDILQDWKEQQKINKTDDPGYVCRETEKMSNIMSMRKTLNVGPGGNITYNMLKPYIIRQKYDTDISWVLMCWAKNDFPDINQMLNKMNQLAFNQNKKNNPSATNVA
jgi:hypothetical protein